MAVNVARLAGPLQLATGPTTQYTAAAGTTVRVDKASFTNTTANSEAISLYVVPSGDSAAADTQITMDKAILPGATWNCPDIVGQVLNAGDFIATACSGGTAITAIIDGTIFS